MQKEIKALMIDPYEQTVKELTFRPTLENLYAVIGCKLIAGFFDTCGAYFTYDDEYLVTGNPVAFCQLDGWTYPMGGRLIVTGAGDDDGYHTDIETYKLEDIRRRLRWI